MRWRVISRHNRKSDLIGVVESPRRSENMDAKTDAFNYSPEKPRCGIEPGSAGQADCRRFDVASVPGHRSRNGVSSFTDAMKHNCQFGLWATSPSGKYSHVTVTCNSWGCKSCRKKLITGWVTHFADCTGRLPAVYRHTVERSEWDNLYARLNRRDIRYIAVAASATRTVVYTDKPHGDCEAMSPADAEVTFRRELNGYVHGLHQHPVSTCRQWKQKRKPSKYKRVPDVKPVKAEHVRKAAEQLGIQLKPWTSDAVAGLEVLSSGEDAQRLISVSEEVRSAAYRRRCSTVPKGFNGAIPTRSPRQQFPAPPGRRPELAAVSRGDA